MSNMLKFLCLAVCVVCANGCIPEARVVVTTGANGDGSYTRRVEYYAYSGQENGDMLTYGRKLNEDFVLPRGTPWKTKRRLQEDYEVYIAERTLQVGEPLQHDIVIKESKKAKDGPFDNEGIVREIMPGRLEYREVLRWQGGRAAKKNMDLVPEMFKLLKDNLPKALANDLTAQDINSTLSREMWRVLMGPNDPLIFQNLLHPDLDKRRFNQRIGAVVDKALREKFGDRLNTAERLVVTRKLLKEFNATDIVNKAMSGPGPERRRDDGTWPVPLTFAVRLPGKVVATNGEYDEITSEVFWGLYHFAPAFEDVVLTATWEVEK